MDVNLFLLDRMEFIRRFYETASGPFSEIKRKIEAHEEPFAADYGEYDKPDFLNEWIEADESLQALGYACISMLAAALHYYLRTWESELRVPAGNSSLFKKKGWLKGYRRYFMREFGINFSLAPANLAILEEVVLARNQIQHSDDLFTAKKSYSSSDIKKLPQALFLHETEEKLLSEVDAGRKSFMWPPGIYTSSDKLVVATNEAEKFGRWLDAEIRSKGFTFGNF